MRVSIYIEPDEDDPLQPERIEVVCESISTSSAPAEVKVVGDITHIRMRHDSFQLACQKVSGLSLQRGEAIK